MAAHARLKNGFTEDEKCHNLMSWLLIFFPVPCPTKTETISCGKRKKSQNCTSDELKKLVRIVNVVEKTEPKKKASRGCEAAKDYGISDNGLYLWTKNGCVANFTVDVCDLEGKVCVLNEYFEMTRFQTKTKTSLYTVTRSTTDCKCSSDNQSVNFAEAINQ